MYLSTKLYDHNLGLSACFRQHKATHSHCSMLHGYALAFKFVFSAKNLDSYNWVVDFGSLRGLKELLQKYFDHKLIVAEDDPQRDSITALVAFGIADVVVMPAVGCEAFAEFGAQLAHQYLQEQQQASRVRVMSCEVSEHGANSAIFVPRDNYFDTPKPPRQFFGQQQRNLP